MGDESPANEFQPDEQNSQFDGNELKQEPQEAQEELDGNAMEIENQVEEGGEEEEHDHDDEEEEEPIHDEEAIEKSRIQKESFLEIFRIAPTVRDILSDLRTFINHPDVIRQDKKEVEQLVALKIVEEKAKKKAEKERKEQDQAAASEKPAIDLAQAIRNVTGLDLAGILQKTSQRHQPVPVVPIPIVSSIPSVPQTINLMPPSMSSLALPPAPKLPPELANAPLLTLGNSSITAIRVGKAGFSTPHPGDTAQALQAARPEVPPIPEALRTIINHKKPDIPAIPNELLPLDQRVPVAPPVAEPSPFTFIRPPRRKTLLMAGARAGKRSEIRAALAKEEKKSKTPFGQKDRSNSSNRRPERQSGRAGWGGDRDRDRDRGGPSSMPSGLNRNTPLAVRRYHARQLVKDTGMSFAKAMDEIDDQCAQFGGNEDPASREANEQALSVIRAEGDRRFNERHNYTPADHSQGIPGVDRPPGGGRVDRDRDMGRRDTRDRERGVPGVDRPPGGPGIDRPPGGPGVDRPPGGYGGPGGMPRKKRGGVKEREKQRRREEMRRGEYGGLGGRGRWADNRDSRAPGPPPSKQGRYDDQRRGRGYEEYYSNTYQQESGAYDGSQDYQGYYEGQEGYENYDQAGAEGYANYDYYQAQEGQHGSYYQEDGSQYYNDYYAEAGQEGYQATFDTPEGQAPK